MRQLWAPWRMAYVSGEEPASSGCFLCAAATEAETDAGCRLLVERTEATVTVLNRFPYSSGHVMVAPRRHITELAELSAAEGGELMAAAQRAVRAITELMHPGGFNVGLNLGRAAGESIEHLHLHVVPRWGGDTNFMPVLADVKVLPEHLEVTAARLRAALSPPLA
jgi:ATP adenylyltransferase